MPERAGSSTPRLESVPAPLLDDVVSPSVGSTLTSPTTQSSQHQAPHQPNLLQAPVTVGLPNGIGGATTPALIHWGDLAVWAVGCRSAGWRIFMWLFHTIAPVTVIIPSYMQGLWSRPLPTVHWDQQQWSDDNQCLRLDDDRD